jgi:hypothetical protein
MRHFPGKFFVIFGIVFLSARMVSAGIDAQPLGTDGVASGCAIGVDGKHVAALITKGSRFAVVIDGVEGPRIDALLQNVVGGISGVASYWSGNNPDLVFSDDGAHCAYFAKMGDQIVVMLDNKEVARTTPSSLGASINIGLTFSSGAKHLFFMDASDGKYRMFVDGKPGPDSSTPMPLITSPDGSHYVYTGFVGPLGNGIPNWSFVDGRQVNYFGGELQYTARNVLLSTVNVDNNTNVLLLNGKPEVKGYRLSPRWISADGLQIAIVVQPTSNAPTVLTVNGKEVDGTQGLEVDNVYFSPNGKRYAALCTTKTHSRFMIIDGKKGEEYQNIFPTVNNAILRMHWAFVAGGDPDDLAKAQPQVPGFTPDSSKFVYVASQGSQQFMDVEDQESNGFQASFALQPVLSATGNRIALYGIGADGQQHVIVDDKDVPLAGGTSANNNRVTDLSFSPGGTRYAYVAGGTLYVDGTAQPGYVNGGSYLFSADDQHFAYLASIANAQCLLVDGKIVNKTPGQMRYAFFSPDSQHFFFVKMGNLQAQGTKDPQMLFADGQPVVHLTDNGVGGSFLYHFAFPSANTMTFVGRTDGNLRRFTFTPSSDLSSMLASATVPTGK